MHTYSITDLVNYLTNKFTHKQLCQRNLLSLQKKKTRNIVGVGCWYGVCPIWVAATRIFSRISLRVEGIMVKSRSCSSKLSHPLCNDHPVCNDATNFTVKYLFNKFVVTKLNWSRQYIKPASNPGVRCETPLTWNASFFSYSK